jgi:PTH1 family peptidyl-tRNA hydrolase
VSQAVTRLVVGLGNPGPEYAITRHNAGFFVVDLLAENLRAAYWKDEAGAKATRVRFGDDELVLAKPQTFMNISGKSVRRLLDAYEVPVDEIVVVHDDLDLPEGVVRAKKGGGHGGHNGLRSLTEALGGGEFLRVRVGIGRPPGRQDPADFVLEPMKKDAFARMLETAVPDAAQCVLHVLEQGVDSAMREYNQG